MKTDPFEKIIQPWVLSSGGLFPTGKSPCAYGISYWRENRPSRCFKSREDMEAARLDFIRAAGRGLNLIRLARETKYYVNGVNVPNRV
jgi:hypothetical protein